MNDEHARGRIWGGRYREQSSEVAHGDRFVTQAWDLTRARWVALKGVRIEDQVVRARVLASAREAAALDHPNVAVTYEALVDGEWLLVAREWIQGATVLEATRDADRAAKVAALGAIAAALSAAHKRGVVHGRLRDANIFVERDGSLKVADFGLCERAVSPEGDRTAWKTLAGALLGGDIETTLEAVNENGGPITLEGLVGRLDVRRGVERADEAPPSREARSSTRTITGILGGIALGVIALMAIDRYVVSGDPPAERSLTNVDASADAKPIRETPSPATALFRAAMQAARDASMEQARAQMDQAIALEPTYAAAHLRRALFSYGVDASVREHFARATELRSALTPRERVLLDAFEPCMRMEPAPGLTVARLETALTVAPNDSELHYALGVARWFAGDLAGSVRDLDASSALDASFAESQRFAAFVRTMLGDPTAGDAYARCIERFPSATSCMRGLAMLDVRTGKCADAQLLARRIIALDPDSPGGYATLAQSLQALGTADESVRDAIDREIALIPEVEREPVRQSRNASLAILHGDFRAALVATTTWRSALARESDEWAQLTPVDLAVDVLIETNRRAEAAQLASSFLKSRGGWVTEMGRDAAAIILAASLYRAGALSRPELNARRDEWLAQARASRPLLGAVNLQEAWLLAYGISIVTREDALEAIAARTTLPEPPQASRDPLYFDAFVGLAYARAGQPNEAIPYLERAKSSCAALDQPIIHTLALAALGDALADAGNSARACTVYRAVLARWGTSTTAVASKARAQVRRLRCDAN